MKAFKISAVVLIAAVVFGCVEGQNTELCTEDEKANKTIHLTVFIHSLQKNPNSDCSVELDGLRNCTLKQAISCQPELQRTNSTIAIIKSSLEKSLTKKAFCDQAGIVIPDFQTAQGNLTLAVLCNITISESIAILNRCLKPVVNMWQANKADKRLCGEFAKAKCCRNKAFFDDRKCVKDANITKYDHYNWFCPNGRDPGCAASTFLPHKILFLFVPLTKMLF